MGDDGNCQEYQKDMMEVMGFLAGSENGNSNKIGMQISTRICLWTWE